MTPQIRYTIRVALTVALGGFLMGFDASVISGVVTFIEPEFQLSNIQLGWAVASLTLTATLAMMVSGPLSDRFGRRTVLKWAAVLFSLSAVASAFAPDYLTLVAARMLGGLGVGAALIIAPMYIAELAAPDVRGRMVSFNQLNIVIGISAAYFSNYLILSLGQSDLAWAEALRLAEWNWRWMLGVEALPAIFYFIALFFVPESPRWLIMHGREAESVDILARATGPEKAAEAIEDVKAMLRAEASEARGTLRELFAPAMKLVLTIGIVVAVLQQITGINAVFFYAPMIFEQSGVGTDASFMQAVLVGLVNLVFTVLAILTIDKLGRRPLLLFGLTVIAACMFLLAWGFGSATYTLTPEAVAGLPQAIDAAALQPLLGQTFDSDVAFRQAVSAVIGAEAFGAHQSALVSGAISMNPTLILFGILGFVAGFAISLGPVMWVLFSELFPNRVRGIAISFVGLINSGVSFLVQLVFPWELETLGNSTTFLLFGSFAVVGLVIVLRLLPETKGKSLEELEAQLVHKP
ncbi:MAG: sugar porter family MFS transporter [Xanthomonadales bacterium]